MAIIKHKDIYDDSKSAFDNLLKDLERLNTEVVTLTKSNVNLSQSLQTVKKSSDGAEAEKLVKTTDKLKKSTKELTEVQKQRLAVKKQLNIVFAKSITANEKSNKILAKGKLRLQENNKLLKQQAKEALGLVGAYEKESKTLIKLRTEYKNLAVQNKQNTKEGKALLANITKLDAKLKAVDNSVGQNQRSVGKYTNALKGLGSQLLGAAGITVGLTSVIEAGKAFVKQAGILIDITRKVEQTFNLSGNSAKFFASNVLAISQTFGEDYNEILKAANTISKELDISSTQALKHIEEGFLKGSNNTGEFLEILKEYPTQFRAAGISAETMFSIINQQVREGIYSDKGVDAIKEGGLRLRENTKAVQEALRPFDDYTKQQIALAVESGNSFEAIQLVSKGLSDTKLTAAQTQAVIADVFGGAGEDAGLRYLKTLADIEVNLKNVEVQAGETQKSSLVLSTTWNLFTSSVADDESVLVGVWNYLKLVLAGLVSELNKLFSIFDSDKGFKAIGKTTSKIKENTKAVEDETVAIVKLTSAQKKRVAEEKALNKAFKERDTEIITPIESLGAETDKVDISPLQKQIDAENKLKADKRAEELLNIQDWEDGKEKIAEQAISSSQQLASDIFSSFQDEKLAQINSDAEAEKKILQQKLDDGIISEEQFAAQSAAIDKKQRIAAAKADKKKAIFDIFIATAIAVAKAGFITPAAIAIGAAGLIQAGAVAAKPIPKFAKGTEFVEGSGTGTSDSVHAMLSKGERVVPESINNMLNGIPNSELPKLMNKQQDNMLLAHLLMKGNSNSDALITLMGNMGWSYRRDGEMIVNKADGSMIEKFNIG